MHKCNMLFFRPSTGSLLRVHEPGDTAREVIDVTLDELGPAWEPRDWSWCDDHNLNLDRER
jgi:hypothetical protein